MKILITAPYNEPGRQEIDKSIGKVIYRPWKTKGRAYNEDELISLLSETKAEALITEHDEVSSKVIETFPNLKFIGVCRGTPSNIALEEAKRNGIPVYNTPGRNAQAVTEMFLAGVIILMRKIIPANSWLENKKWEKGAHTSYLEFKGNELANKTIGMIGFGDIGQCIANVLRDLPCKIQYYDPYVKCNDSAYESVTLDEVFSSSDVVSVHLPVNSETTGMIDKECFSKMNDDAIFVNTARSSVVDRNALYEILSLGGIAGAYLDVFDHEPPDDLDYKIIELPNVFATPHIAGATHEVEDHHVRIMNKTLKEEHGIIVKK